MPDVPEIVGTNFKHILLKEFRQIQRECIGGSVHSRSERDESEGHLWVVTQWKAASNLGLAFVLSDGKTGITFKDGVTTFSVPGETRYHFYGMAATTNAREKKNKVSKMFMRHSI